MRQGEGGSRGEVVVVVVGYVSMTWTNLQTLLPVAIKSISRKYMVVIAWLGPPNPGLLHGYTICMDPSFLGELISQNRVHKEKKRKEGDEGVWRSQAPSRPPPPNTKTRARSLRWVPNVSSRPSNDLSFPTYQHFSLHS